MTEQFQTACPQCDTPLRLPDSSIGKRIRCPKCDTRFVTESDDEISSETPDADSGADVEAAAEIAATDEDVQTTEVAADVVAADESADHVSQNEETNGDEHDLADDVSTANERTHVAIAGSGSSKGESSNGDAASGDAASGGARVPVSGSSSSDRNLLFGVLAWQSGVITQSQLLDAMKQWTFEKDKTLGEILLEQLALAQSQREMLDLLVDTHLQLRRDQTANLRIGSLQAG